MFRHINHVGLIGLAIAASLTSCSNEQQFTNENTDARRVEVNTISPEMAKVRDYVPLYATVAHRGTTFWAPEETEAAWRWARNMGADYLESDLQVTKDGVVLANHDENLKRTTNVEDLFSEEVPSVRKDFYRSFRNADGSQHFTEQDIEEQYQRDVADFRPDYAMSYYYAEMLMLDAGKWFNESSLQESRSNFAAKNNGKVIVNAKGVPSIQYADGQYVSALQDQINYAEGKMLKRDGANRRVLPYKIKDEFKNMTLAEIYKAATPASKVDDPSVKGKKAAKYMDFVEYDFKNAYVQDPQDNGNRPGIYPEFKESWLNPKDIEIRVYNILHEWGWNVISKPEKADAPFYVNGKVNVGNTNGKVILQTFSFDALQRAYDVYKGQIPMCFLLWEGTYATDLTYDTPQGYADFINYALSKGAHIIGPAISGAPNNYPEMNNPWQAALIRRAQMYNHPYSFDTHAQMTKYMGYYVNFWGENPTEFDDLLAVTVQPTAFTNFKEAKKHPVYMDGYFTNHAELSLKYMIENGFRCSATLDNPFHPGKKYDNSQAPSTVPDAAEMLNRLGY